tara:strand:+ start:733 stop:1131 length:399 start_codon:yes stop_codon:yes gene_type:complete
MKTLKDISIYGILIPIIVVVLAEVAITISCKYYWGEHLLNFKLSMWKLTLSICLSVIYYLFCMVYKLVKRKADKRLITLLFVLMPILVYHISSSYDYRITLSFALFHCTFYVLFFATRYIWEPRLTKRKKYY